MKSKNRKKRSHDEIDEQLAQNGAEQDAHDAEPDPDETAALIDEISRERDEAVEARDRAAAERDEAIEKYKRALADQQNVLRRSQMNEVEARRQGVDGVVRSVLTVLDHFDLALGQDPTQTTADHIIAGVRVIRDELWKSLAAHGVGLIRPEPNDEFDPNRHEAMLVQPSENIAPGHVAAMLQVGYTLGERVVRPAKVSLAPQEANDDASAPVSSRTSAGDGEPAGDVDAGDGRQGDGGGGDGGVGDDRNSPGDDQEVR